VLTLSWKQNVRQALDAGRESESESESEAETEDDEMPVQEAEPVRTMLAMS